MQPRSCSTDMQSTSGLQDVPVLSCMYENIYIGVIALSGIATVLEVVCNRKTKTLPFDSYRSLVESDLRNQNQSEEGLSR